MAVAAAESGRRIYFGTLSDLIDSLEEAHAAGRLEHAPAGGKPSRYAKIDHDPEKLQDVLADVAVHGRQEGRFYHGYYHHYCFLPLYITSGGRPLFALLRPGNADPAGGVTGPLGRIVARLRQEWPWLKVILRADSAYAREELMAWCKDNDVDYVIGLARNSRLVERIGWLLDDAAAEAEKKGRPARRFAEFPYATLTSWSCKRRVVAKAEHLADKSNPRFVVTSLPADTFSARTVYERLYCARGNMEKHDQGAAARSLLRPDLGHLFRRQPAPASLLRLRVDSLRCPQASASRHPARPRHSRNAPAQAPQDRRPRHRFGSPGQGRHGLRAPLRPGLRTGPRPITGVGSPAASGHLLHPTFTGTTASWNQSGPPQPGSLFHMPLPKHPPALPSRAPTRLTTPVTPSTPPSQASGRPGVGSRGGAVPIGSGA